MASSDTSDLCPEGAHAPLGNTHQAERGRTQKLGSALNSLPLRRDPPGSRSQLCGSQNPWKGGTPGAEPLSPQTWVLVQLLTLRLARLWWPQLESSSD